VGIDTAVRKSYDEYFVEFSQDGPNPATEAFQERILSRLRYIYPEMIHSGIAAAGNYPASASAAAPLALRLLLTQNRLSQRRGRRLILPRARIDTIAITGV
jgi:hypothetical protein